ncbi:lipase family protein [Candidatus Nephthysia bennettiae]|uniref:Alpha/beta hydrolase n=1 Tax=Candidatus Nephthysia bennettiae TaxID=3127016 RepID=A0A934K6F7_9BACT|nr:alpha/beta hydrolase [Candidatus Dormibacteraeota bacterium]MBJ7614744.1 alpha/beta hydrolase [Candidatus Dormibacteraeota bacterium]
MAAQGTGMDGRPRGRARWPRRHPLLTVLAALAVIVVTLGGTLLVRQHANQAQTAARQQALAPFYDVPGSAVAGPPGSVIRSEPLDFAPAGSRGWRLLFRSQDATGRPTVSSGMVFAPDGPTPAGGRPVLAWAHGTVGMGPACAPSRAQNPLSQLDPFLGAVLQQGWVVTAPDYAGLGTPGVLAYLIGAAEAHDVLNSVRAARSLAQAGAGTTLAIWGHSQGGQSSLFAAALAASYAPELRLVAAGAAAPAAEVVPLFRQQYDKAIVWAIGPEVAVAWPATYPGLAVSDVLTPVGLRAYQQTAHLCVVGAALQGIVRQDLLRQKFFGVDPTANPAWRAPLEANTAPLPPPGIPLLIAQGLADQVVLPDTTALLVQRYCAAGAPLTTFWDPGASHAQIATAAGPMFASWLADRTAGRPQQSSCGEPLPVTPASP